MTVIPGCAQGQGLQTCRDVVAQASSLASRPSKNPPVRSSRQQSLPLRICPSPTDAHFEFTQLAFSGCPPALHCQSPPVSASGGSSDLAATGRPYQYLTLALSLHMRLMSGLARPCWCLTLARSHLQPCYSHSDAKILNGPSVAPSAQPGRGLSNFSLIKKHPIL